MATTTPNYSLHQWGTGEQLLRTTLNEALWDIDTAMHQAQTEVNTALKGKANTSDLSSLQSQLSGKASVSSLNSLSATVGTKCRAVVGMYTGTGSLLNISLGGQPKAVMLIFLFDTLCAIENGGKTSQLAVTSSGFSVDPGISGLNFNLSGTTYKYVALM